MKPGERIRDLRDKKGYSQSKFSKELKISQGYLAQIEKGIRDPSREFLKKLNEIFGISSDYILYGITFERESNIEGVNFVVREQGSYEVLNSNRERRMPQNNPKRKVVNRVIKILESGNKTVIRALEANIEAFSLVIKTEESEIKGGD